MLDTAPTSTITFGPLEVRHHERVLEPRPWTLMQSEWAAELSEGRPDGPILELCCGAGHIGLAAAALTGRDLVQVDCTASACELARINAHANGLDSRVEVRQGDLGRVVRAGESFPLVLADPPYLPSALVRSYPRDPVPAIDGGPDGRALLRRCVDVAAAALAPGGVALVQVHGERQALALGDELPSGLRVEAVRSHDGDRAVALLVRRAEP